MILISPLIMMTIKMVLYKSVFIELTHNLIGLFGTPVGHANKIEVFIHFF
jgi:hypothetical protein